MNLQHERIERVCEQLKLGAIAQSYPAVAQAAVANESSFTDFLESLLKEELSARQIRTQATMMRLAGLVLHRRSRRTVGVPSKKASKKYRNMYDI